MRSVPRTRTMYIWLHLDPNHSPISVDDNSSLFPPDESIVALSRSAAGVDDARERLAQGGATE